MNIKDIILNKRGTESKTGLIVLCIILLLLLIVYGSYKANNEYPVYNEEGNVLARTKSQEVNTGAVDNKTVALQTENIPEAVIKEDTKPVAEAVKEPEKKAVTKKAVTKKAKVSALKKEVLRVAAKPAGYITGVIVGGKEEEVKQYNPIGYIVGVIVGGKEVQSESPIGYIVGVIVGGRERQTVAGKAGVYDIDGGYIAGVIVGNDNGEEMQVIVG